MVSVKIYYVHACPTLMEHLLSSQCVTMSPTEYPDKKEACKDAMIHLIQLCQLTTEEQERKHFTV